MQRFLELAVPAPDIQASLAFYEALGFSQALVGEVWNHPYAVVSDGRALLGLHGARIEDITPTFVHAGLVGWHRELEDQGILSIQAQLDADSFNRIHLKDPDGGPVLLLEARTYSPPPRATGTSQLGFFGEYTLSARDLAAARGFWEALGLVEGWSGDAPHRWTRLSGSDVNLGLHENPGVMPGLAFFEADMPARIAALRELGHHIATPGRRPVLPHCLGILRAPEGTLMYLCDEAGWQP